MQRFLNMFCVLSLLFFKASNSVHIKNINVPHMIVINEENVERRHIVLDCDYELDHDGSSLVVKWYKDNQAMYQWIRGFSPTVFSKFREDVDDDFKTSSNESFMYSSLALINPSLESTGDYKCVVQTSGGTAAMEKHLQVVDISNYSLVLVHHRIGNETQLQCSVDNVYPKPTLVLNAIDDDEEVLIISSKVNDDENGLYNATIIAVVGDDDEDPDAYGCTVTFDKLELNLTTTAVSSAMKLCQWSEVLFSTVLAVLTIVVGGICAN